MYYKLQSGILINVGKQVFKDATVPVEINGKHIMCPMFSHDDGDIGFIIENEEVLFHWLKHKPY